MKKPTFATGTDWERVKREAAADAPIDDQSGPYDPSDTAAVSAYWQQATITGGRDRQTRINAVLRDAVAHGVTKP